MPFPAPSALSLLLPVWLAPGTCDWECCDLSEITVRGVSRSSSSARMALPHRLKTTDSWQERVVLCWRDQGGLPVRSIALWTWEHGTDAVVDYSLGNPLWKITSITLGGQPQPENPSAPKRNHYQTRVGTPAVCNTKPCSSLFMIGPARRGTQGAWGASVSPWNHP